MISIFEHWKYRGSVAFAATMMCLLSSMPIEAQTEALQAPPLVSVEYGGDPHAAAFPEAALPQGLTTDEEIKTLPTIEAVLGLLPETVCGVDTRVRQTVTTTFPKRTTCQLILTLPNNTKATCTGFLIGRGTVATAGHCVHTGGTSGGWMRRIEVIPGRNGTATGSRPFGTIVSTSLRSVTGWTVNRSSNSDYGAIILPTKIGNTTGWLGFGSYSNSNLTGLFVNSYGYPGDKPTGTMWYTRGNLTGVATNRLSYLFDTAGGQSGSAIYRITTTGSRIAVGIHTNGGCPNSATRITNTVFSNLLVWKNQGGG